MGSGLIPTTAKRGGFGFVGIDPKEEYVEIAEARTDEKELQLVRPVD